MSNNIIGCYGGAYLYPDFVAKHMAGGVWVDDPALAIARATEGLLALRWLTKRTARHELFMSDEQRTYAYGTGKCPECEGRGTRVEDTVLKQACRYCRGTTKAEYHSTPFCGPVPGCLSAVNKVLGGRPLNACFLNKYDNQHQHIGWHADHFEGMDPNTQVAIISLGAEREIWLKDKRGFQCYRCGGSGRWKNPSMSGSGESIGCPLCSSVYSYDPEGCGSGWVPIPLCGKQPVSQRVLLKAGSLFVMPPGYQDRYLHRIPKHDRPCGPRISLTFRAFNPQ